MIRNSNKELTTYQIPLNLYYVLDPCLHKHCGAGRICHLNNEGEAECLCIPSCPLERDPRRKVTIQMITDELDE